MLGGPNADRAMLITDEPANFSNGQVTAASIQTNDGALVGDTGNPGQGHFASKILVKA